MSPCTQRDVLAFLTWGSYPDAGADADVAVPADVDAGGAEDTGAEVAGAEVAAADRGSSGRNACVSV